MAKKKSTAIAKWDEELAKQAEAAAAQEAGTGGGQFFSLRGGTLSFNDAPLPNNEMAVVIVDSVLENVRYEGDYDSDNPTSPTCFAFGRSEETITPHDDVEKPGAKQCADCDANKWGSADVGRGKACKNRRRLAIISAGTLDKQGEFEPGEDLNGDVAYLALPVTSINSYGAYVKQIAGALKRPPHAVITKVSVVPDQKTQFKVLFTLIGPVGNEDLGGVIERNKLIQKEIGFPYGKFDDSGDAKPKDGKSKKSSGKKKRKY